jgi:hypothetical protein
LSTTICGSWARETQGPFEIRRIIGLVGVDEDEVERAQPLGLDVGQGFQRRADSDLDLAGKSGTGDVPARDVSVLGVPLETYEPAVVRQGARQPDGRIAAERADLERFARA